MQKHSMRSFKSGIHAGKGILIACFLLVALRDGIGASPRRTSSQAVIILVAEDCSFSTAVHSLPVDDTKSVSTSIWISSDVENCSLVLQRMQILLFSKVAVPAFARSKQDGQTYALVVHVGFDQLGSVSSEERWRGHKPCLSGRLPESAYTILVHEPELRAGLRLSNRHAGHCSLNRVSSRPYADLRAPLDPGDTVPAAYGSFKFT
jgi:hypothetical protein